MYFSKLTTGIGTGLVALAAAVASAGLTGCGMGGSFATTPAAPVTAVRGAISGAVHGGQQPVMGATIQLYTVGTSGLGSAARALLSTTVTSSDGTGVGGNVGNAFNTMPAGNFTITGLYSCTGATQVYLVATQGSSSTGNNSAIALMAPLGSCATLQANAATTNVQINELSTVTSVYALAPYMTNYANVGSTSTQTGLVNAVGNFNNLYNLSSGAVGGPSLPAGAVLPTAELNTLGNILAACINSSSSSSTPCTTLLGATSASDTIGAALAIARNPASSVYTSNSANSVFSLSPSVAPFQPTLTTAPTDWTVAIKYNAGGGLLAPYNIAIDAAGDAWVTNTGGSSVIELTPSGAVGTTLSGSLAGPKGIAIDRSGNVWVTNPSANTVVKFAGGTGSGAPYTVGAGPVALAIDSAGTAWVANEASNSVSSVTSSGTVSNFTSSGLGLSAPAGIAIDSSGGNIYVANNGGGNVVKLTNPGGAAAAGSPFTDNALQGTVGVVLDASNNVYAVGSTTGTAETASVAQFTSSGAAASFSPALSTATTGIAPSIVALGTNSVLMTNGATSGNLVQLATATGTSINLGVLNAPIGLAVDLSGDVWVANSGDNTVSVFLGLTTPVATPIAATVGP